MASKILKDDIFVKLIIQMFKTTIFRLLKMTLLSAQLMRMRQETTAALDVDKRTKITILFTPEEAAKISNEVRNEVRNTDPPPYLLFLKKKQFF